MMFPRVEDEFSTATSNRNPSNNRLPEPIVPPISIIEERPPSSTALPRSNLLSDGVPLKSVDFTENRRVQFVDGPQRSRQKSGERDPDRINQLAQPKKPHGVTGNHGNSNKTASTKNPAPKNSSRPKQTVFKTLANSNKQLSSSTGRLKTTTSSSTARNGGVSSNRDFERENEKLVEFTAEQSSFDPEEFERKLLQKVDDIVQYQLKPIHAEIRDLKLKIASIIPSANDAIGQNDQSMPFSKETKGKKFSEAVTPKQSSGEIDERLEQFRDLAQRLLQVTDGLPTKFTSSKSVSKQQGNVNDDIQEESVVDTDQSSSSTTTSSNAAEVIQSKKDGENAVGGLDAKSFEVLLKGAETNGSLAGELQALMMKYTDDERLTQIVSSARGLKNDSQLMKKGQKKKNKKSSSKPQQEFFDKENEPAVCTDIHGDDRGVVMGMNVNDSATHADDVNEQQQQDGHRRDAFKAANNEHYYQQHSRYNSHRGGLPAFGADGGYEFGGAERRRPSRKPMITVQRQYTESIGFTSPRSSPSAAGRRTNRNNLDLYGGTVSIVAEGYLGEVEERRRQEQEQQQFYPSSFYPPHHHPAASSNILPGAAGLMGMGGGQQQTNRFTSYTPRHLNFPNPSAADYYNDAGKTGDRRRRSRNNKTSYPVAVHTAAAHHRLGPAKKLTPVQEGIGAGEEVLDRRRRHQQFNSDQGGNDRSFSDSDDEEDEDEDDEDGWDADNVVMSEALQRAGGGRNQYLNDLEADIESAYNRH